jgi:hypothetical protein
MVFALFRRWAFGSFEKNKLTNLPPYPKNSRIIPKVWNGSLFVCFKSFKSFKSFRRPQTCIKSGVARGNYDIYGVNYDIYGVNYDIYGVNYDIYGVKL